MSRTLTLSALILMLLLPVGLTGSFATPALAHPPVNPQSFVSNIMTLYPDWITDGVQQSAEYGYSVSSAGDVDGDGYQDVIIGSSQYSLDVYREGVAFLFKGNPQGLSEDPVWSAGGGLKGSRFGHSVSTAGDVNCDGYADVVIGAPRFNQDHPEEGAVYVYYGSPAGLSLLPDWSVQSDQKSAQLGASVSSAGDVNGDGCDDLLAGAPYYSNGQASEGAVFLYLGSPAGLGTVPAWTIEGDQGEALLGSAVSRARDVNGDGYDDVVIGAPLHETVQVEEGQALVFLGSASGLSALPALVVNGEQSYARLGEAVSTAGDINNDGYADIVIGAPGYDNPSGLGDEGAAIVYFGSSGGLSASNRWIGYSGQAGSGFGVSVASAADLDGDGCDEVIVGAHHYTQDQPYEGAAFIYKGSPAGLDTSPHWLVEGNKNDSWFGFSAANAGDVNQDGFADLLVGAPLYRRDEKTIMGRVFVYHGLEGVEQPPVYPLYLPFIHLEN